MGKAGLTFQMDTAEMVRWLAAWKLFPREAV
jgi:hypothetical protein